MNSDQQIIKLSSLEYIAYLDNNGSIDEGFHKKIGVYAIFDRDRTLQFVGYSRDIFLSLKQHLVRYPEKCYWVKIQTITHPSRTLLEAIRQNWIEENGSTPPGNGEQELIWDRPIDVKPTMNEQEKLEYKQSEEIVQIKLLKTVARRREAEVNAKLKERGVSMDLRFNPKLKEQGLLDLK